MAYTNKCERCGNPQYNRSEDRCYDKGCYWYSHWMPTLDMAPEEEHKHIIDINNITRRED